MAEDAGRVIEEKKVASPAPGAERNAAILGSPAALRALVRDVVAEELLRYWERRFGGRP